MKIKKPLSLATCFVILTTLAYIAFLLLEDPRDGFIRQMINDLESDHSRDVSIHIRKIADPHEISRGDIVDFPWDLIATDENGNIYTVATTQEKVNQETPGKLLNRMDTAQYAGPVYLIKVTPDGKIHPQYEFLVMESSHPKYWVQTVSFSMPHGLALKTNGGFLLTEPNHGLVITVDPDSKVHAYYNNKKQYEFYFFDDKGTASSVDIDYPYDLARDPTGNILIADGVIRKIMPNGSISTFHQTKDVKTFTTDSNGYVFAVNEQGIVKIAPNGTASLIVANNKQPDDTSRGEVGQALDIDKITDIAADDSGHLYIIEKESNDIKKISPGGKLTSISAIENSVLTSTETPELERDVIGAPLALAFNRHTKNIVVLRNSGIFTIEDNERK
ncbi:hypothetical protein [Chitinilyticum aquatile]|uniref:hypothetical protein n=1 Tax=Chitinilyticum aquatile TaxID=362520 RepID=UPI00041A0143|nr:hypothetical protein [Chitinilyticum aquatile]